MMTRLGTAVAPLMGPVLVKRKTGGEPYYFEPFSFRNNVLFVRGLPAVIKTLSITDAYGQPVQELIYGGVNRREFSMTLPGPHSWLKSRQPLTIEAELVDGTELKFTAWVGPASPQKVAAIPESLVAVVPDFDAGEYGEY